MSETGVYFPARRGLAFSDEARIIRQVLGYKGYFQYVALLCKLLDDGGKLNLDSTIRWDMMKLDLEAQDSADIHKLLELLEELGELKCTRDESGFINSVKSPFIESQVRIYTSTSKARSDAGRRGAQARWGNENADE